jgi:hypothetical protein
MVANMTKVEKVIATDQKEKHILSESDLVEFLTIAWNLEVGFNESYTVSLASFFHACMLIFFQRPPSASHDYGNFDVRHGLSMGLRCRVE